MINCAKCGKDNQDHYKFCLGCGAELSKDAAPKPFSPDTPPQGVAARRVSGAPQPMAGGPAPMVAPSPTDAPPARVSAPEVAAQPNPSQASVNPGAAVAPQASNPELAAAAGPRECPQCGQTNAPTNRFCASCGYNLGALARSAPPAAATGVRVRLTALRADGTEAGSFDLPNEPRSTIGRDTGSIFAGDSYLSPRHATFIRQDNDVQVRDEGSLNGVYVKIQPHVPWPLAFGDIFRIGQEIIRLEALERQPPSPDGVERLGSPRDGYVGRLALVIGRDTTGNAFPIPREGVHCGRERGDILFSEDGYVSGLHCRVAPSEDGRIYLTDVGSSNGTFVRLSGERRLNNGDILLMGQQLFRFDAY